MRHIAKDEYLSELKITLILQVKIFKLLLGEISNHLSEVLAYARSRGGGDGDASTNVEEEEDDDEDEGWEDDGEDDGEGMEQEKRAERTPSSAFYLSHMLDSGNKHLLNY